MHIQYNEIIPNGPYLYQIIGFFTIIIITTIDAHPYSAYFFILFYNVKNVCFWKSEYAFLRVKTKQT